MGKPEKTGYSCLRKGRRSITQQVYLVTWITAGRSELFRELLPARVVINSLQFADDAGWSKTFAYVLMPDHIHWLFELRGSKHLSQLVASTKRYSATRLKRLGFVSGNVWQEGFHDRAARVDDDLAKLSRYICANPLRAGRCDEIGQYPHWDAVWMDS